MSMRADYTSDFMVIMATIRLLWLLWSPWQLRGYVFRLLKWISLTWTVRLIVEVTISAFLRAKTFCSSRVTQSNLVNFCCTCIRKKKNWGVVVYSLVDRYFYPFCKMDHILQRTWYSTRYLFSWKYFSKSKRYRRIFSTQTFLTKLYVCWNSIHL